MKTKKLFVAAVVSVGLAFGVAVQATEESEQAVDMKSLPAAVQKTIKEKAAGGEIVRVEKENDKGKWNYEVVVMTKGKEWGFEVNKDGKYLGQKHDEGKEHKEKGEKY